MEPAGEEAAAIRSEPPPASGERLFSPRQVFVATFLGSPVAGGILLALNYRCLGERGRARVALILGLAALAGMFALGSLLPNGPGHSSTTLPMAAAVGCYWAAEALQGPRYKAHLAAGGRAESWWRVVGWGLGSLAAIMVPVVVMALLVPGLF